MASELSADEVSKRTRRTNAEHHKVSIESIVPRDKTKSSYADKTTWQQVHSSMTHNAVKTARHDCVSQFSQ